MDVIGFGYLSKHLISKKSLGLLEQLYLSYGCFMVIVGRNNNHENSFWKFAEISLYESIVTVHGAVPGQLMPVPRQPLKMKSPSGVAGAVSRRAVNIAVIAAYSAGSIANQGYCEGWKPEGGGAGLVGIHHDIKGGSCFSAAITAPASKR
jgi:hypothetical protein